MVSSWLCLCTVGVCGIILQLKGSLLAKGLRITALEELKNKTNLNTNQASLSFKVFTSPIPLLIVSIEFGLLHCRHIIIFYFLHVIEHLKTEIN